MIKRDVPTVSTYFTASGDIWTPDSQKNIAHAVLEYKDGCVLEGAHNGRHFNGLLELFNVNASLNHIAVYDAFGEKDAKASEEAVTKVVSSKEEITLTNNLSQSLAASHYLKTLGLR